MKRRNADCGKIRRPIKRNKITEGMYGSTTVLYLKFLILWAIVITADFMFMFRFEFLWPFWLLLRSVHDSFKYKGLAFSVLFVCIAITSDLVCLFFIPVHWLLFAASTYVWVQYVWHTDKGICLPTIILWILFVYLEAGIRWKDSRHMPHLDLCRPFAAHCIGYPVVTLGFGFKSYIGYRMRQRKQREVAKENEFYMQLLQQALPQDESISSNNAQIHSDDGQHHQNGGILHCSNNSSAGQLIGAIPVAQQVQISQNSSNSSITNSLLNHHHHHHQHNHHNSSSVADNASNGNIYHQTNADVQIGQTTSSVGTAVGSSSVTPLTATALSSSSTTMSFSSSGVSNAILNYSSNNMNNISNYSTNKTAQNITNNKLNNSLSNTSTQFSVANTQSSTTTTTNGHVSSGNYNNNINNTSNTTNNSKNNRKGLDKDINKKYETNSKLSSNLNLSSASYHEISKDTKQGAESNWIDGSNIATDTLTPASSILSFSSTKSEDKENLKFLSNGGPQSNIYSCNNTLSSTTTTVSEKENNSSHNHNNYSKAKSNQHNGNVSHFDTEEVAVVADPPERTKGRKARSKRGDNNNKDNHHNNNSSTNTNNTSYNSNSTNNNTYHHNNHHHSKDSHGNSDTSSNSSSTSSAVSTASATITNLASQIVTKICDTCHRLEAEVKKYRAEISHMKQIEHELRQKLDSNVTTKTCLQAKQRECDELDKRIHEMQNTRQIDLMNLQNIERRLGEERRQRQSLEAQLNNEKKARKTAEDKATRPECSESCKQRKQQMENEIKQLRRELKAIEEAKQNAEQQSRKYEQDLRMFEAEVRNREAQQGTERLISALADMHNKNNTLEKNLSAETRVKLDLFSALGEAKRQLEIKDSLIRNKDNEVLDLKAKIAQLLAIMPSDSLCLSSPCPTTGPSSPMLSLSNAHQQIMASNHPLNSRGGPTSVVAANNIGVVVNGTANSSMNGPSISPSASGNSVNNVNNNSQNPNVSVNVGNMVSPSGQTSSNLDPNATAYTPKNSLVSGSDA